MGNKLETLSKAQLSELVATLPPNKRAGFSKAAKAACQHLKDSKANYAKAYELASAMVENWWRLGVELQRMGLKPGVKPITPPGEQLTLQQLGINHNQSARCQKLADKSKAELDDWLQSQYDEEKYYLPSLKPASAGVHVANNSGNEQWYTPPRFIEAARQAMGGIDLDPASCEAAQRMVKAARYFTAEQDGLSKEWHGRVWMNPPYGSAIVAEFTDKLLDEIDAGRAKQAAVLVNNCTETAWQQDLLSQADACCFVSGRIRFFDEQGEKGGSPLQGQVVFYFGDQQTKFSEVFSELGAIR